MILSIGMTHYKSKNNNFEVYDVVINREPLHRKRIRSVYLHVTPTSYERMKYYCQKYMPEGEYNTENNEFNFFESVYFYLSDDYKTEGKI